MHINRDMVENDIGMHPHLDGSITVGTRPPMSFDSFQAAELFADRLSQAALYGREMVEDRDARRS